MKKFRSYFILILAAAVLSGCSGLNKMKKNSGLIQYDVTPKVLETHAGLVNVTIKGVFPEKYFDKKTTLTATPVLTYPGGETAFEKVQVLQGENVTANNQVITYTGGNFTYTGAVPFKEDMKVSELMLRINAVRGAKSLDFDPVKLADGVIATSTLVHFHARGIMMKDNFVRITPESQIADINYVINRADIRSSELKASDITALRDYIKAVEEDPDRVFKTTTISSYASPDGPLTLNERLSVNRGSAADKFIKREFEKIEAAKSEDFFDAITTAEDWEGFKAEVENSSLRDKDLILRVLSMYSDPVVREREIKNMSEAYEALKTDILPKLRKSKMIVDVDKIGRTDEQILAQAKSDPKVLSLEEMLYAGTLTSDTNEQLAFYKAALEAYPQCIRAANNIGYTLLLQGKTDEAVTALEAAQRINNNDEVKNNLAFAYILKGSLERAEELFNSMSAATTDSKCGLGMIAISKGQYDAAVNYFGTTPCFNTALAQFLKGDINRAKATLDGFTAKCKTGRPGYLKAIIGARQDDRNYMLAGLREAIGFNTDWKAYAKTDVEFAKFWADDAFMTVVQ
ncbi:MAG: tetratricopeptide repeat protein [Bacteroidales bacterium]|nr:tetratricopeptide repeat protein [Bacteroidales bacterium]